MAGPPAPMQPAAQQPYPQQGYPAQPAYGAPAQAGYPGTQPAPTTWAPAAAPRAMNWDLFAFLFRFLGFLLIAVGVLVFVATVSSPANCFNTGSNCGPTGSNFPAAAANGYLWGQLLVAVGALLLGLGAGIKLHWVLRPPADGAPDKMVWVMVERLVNYALIGGAIILLWLILVHTSPITFTPPTS